MGLCIERSIVFAYKWFGYGDDQESQVWFGVGTGWIE
jgi:hypothetical protein